MSTVTAPSDISPVMEDADRLLETDGDERNWPRGREAWCALEWASKSLAEALDAYKRLLGTGFTPLPEDEIAALERAEEQIGDCAVALRKTLAEYRHREEMAALSGEGER